MKLWKKHGVLLVIAFVGCLLFLRLNFVPALAGDAPEAAPHVIDRSGAEQAAVRFVQERVGSGVALEAFAMYAADRDTFGYLYKSGAIDKMMSDFRTTLPLEAYRVEVKETGSGVIHHVDINPYTGEPVEWDLQVKARAVSQDELGAIGTATLKRLGLESLDYKLSSTDVETGVITYTLSNPNWQKATADVSVRADSSGVNRVAVQWGVPASYADLIARQDLWASVLGSVGLLLSAALQLAAMIYALAQLKHVRLSRGIVMAVAFGVMYCTININVYPGLKATVLGIANGAPFGALAQDAGLIAGLISTLIVTNALTLCMAIGLYFSAVSGDALSRRQGWDLWPQHSDTGFGTLMASAVGKGYLFAFVMLGVQSMIYVGAESGFRTWYTIDALTSSNNMLYPALLPLLAWCAAVSEEGVYRLFAIPALKRIVRFTWIGVLVSSMIWALGHVQYPIYPFYTRFVEVTLIGIVFAYIFLKHGFLTAVFTHAIVDTIWMGISITASAPTAASWGIFAAYMAVPAVIGLLAKRLHRRSGPGAPPPLDPV